MKKKVSFVRELQVVIGTDRQVFEMADGAYAMRWMPGSPFTIIFPEELDTNEWGELINPMEVGRCGVESPLITESNLLYNPMEDFCLHWCIAERESDEVTYLRLCNPQDASHVFVEYTHGELKGKALSVHDLGVCSDLQFFHSQYDNNYICFLMPVGYIRLSYENDGVTYFARGVNGPEELAQHYQERSATWRQKAQEKLDAWRTQIDQNAEAIRQAKEFKATHKDELGALDARYSAFLRDAADFAETADLNFRQNITYLSRITLSTIIDRSHGWKISLGRWEFDFSEAGLGELTERIVKQISKLETMKAEQEDIRKRGAIMREVWRDITEIHVRIATGNGDHTRYRVNFQKIWATVDIDTATICSYNRYGVLEEKKFSLAEDRNQIFVHLRTVIAQSKEHWCKFRCTLEDVFNR